MGKVLSMRQVDTVQPFITLEKGHTVYLASSPYIQAVEIYFIFNQLYSMHTAEAFGRFAMKVVVVC